MLKKKEKVIEHSIIYTDCSYATWFLPSNKNKQQTFVFLSVMTHAYVLFLKTDKYKKKSSYREVARRSRRPIIDAATWGLTAGFTAPALIVL